MTAPLVLIVDDDPDMLQLEGEALTVRGYRVVTARNGEEALQRLAEQRDVNLILLDMRMPVMDGWAFARILRDRYGRRIPVIVVTAAEDSKLRANEIGAEADLGKPFDMAQLYHVVEDMVGTP